MSAALGPDDAPRLAPLVDAALAAHEAGDYPAFAALATPALRQRVGEAAFRRAHREIAPTLGALRSTRLLGTLDRDGDLELVYAARYAAEAGEVLVRARFTVGPDGPALADFRVD